MSEKRNNSLIPNQSKGNKNKKEKKKKKQVERKQKAGRKQNRRKKTKKRTMEGFLRMKEDLDKIIQNDFEIYEDDDGKSDLD